MLPTSACSASEAAALERELLEEYRFGRQQLVELCGHASAVAVTKVPSPLPDSSPETEVQWCSPPDQTRELRLRVPDKAEAGSPETQVGGETPSGWG